MTTDEIKEYELLKKKNDLEIYAMQFWKRLDEEAFHKRFTSTWPAITNSVRRVR